ncbi:hypothetical protein [Flavobacterium aquatile]|uniref:Anti-sigma factor n=1 Tax=Flavobacterium aquatile LMG 4008 = ATCC 11947 TaxID=1453498 RepID=A0A095SXJ9_9FLAO|nr:hypothetical protein [Flavobacterium aquatile]KGD69292.1 hypothetical protein LG45_00475 [Flavobacterium aquatile LMG 4008 = ATCC 11947]OXA69544.1 hypothetical protein B0A61_00450 [Flavobacterium aquatile LMG 4008 = ATCC 11947]GEC77751.1 hypothetical protein FAQ01_06210 [Flavobacterium aquatile]
MAQNNIENQIKEKLNSREIQPTEMAWDRLDAMLSVSEEKKTKRFPFLTSKFIGIAASVLVFLSVGLYFINQENTDIEVEESVVVKEEIKINTSEENSNLSKEINSIPVQSKEQVAVTIKNQKSKVGNQQSSQSFNQNNQKTVVNPIINRNKEIEYLGNGDVAQKDLPKIETRKQIVVSKPNYVDVDDLLASVENESKNTKKPSVKVNANTLLSQVDGELEQSFRQKAINRISKNYQEVKVALANRNQE